MNSENRDPVANIMGPAFAQVSSTDNALLKAHEALVKARADAAENVDELDSAFRLMLLINQMDVQLLHSSVENMAK